MGLGQLENLKEYNFMTQEQFLKALSDTYAQNVEISRKKNSDYADDDDAFKNFHACEMLGISAEMGILVRMSDKLVRIGNLLSRKNIVTDEKITDTLQDLSNYAAILKIYLENKLSTSN